MSTSHQGSSATFNPMAQGFGRIEGSSGAELRENMRERLSNIANFIPGERGNSGNLNPATTNHVHNQRGNTIETSCYFCPSLLSVQNNGEVSEATLQVQKLVGNIWRAYGLGEHQQQIQTEAMFPLCRNCSEVANNLSEIVEIMQIAEQQRDKLMRVFQHRVKEKELLRDAGKACAAAEERKCSSLYKKIVKGYQAELQNKYNTQANGNGFSMENGEPDDTMQEHFPSTAETRDDEDGINSNMEQVDGMSEIFQNDPLASDGELEEEEMEVAYRPDDFIPEDNEESILPDDAVSVTEAAANDSGLHILRVEGTLQLASTMYENEREAEEGNNGESLVDMLIQSRPRSSRYSQSICDICERPIKGDYQQMRIHKFSHMNDVERLAALVNREPGSSWRFRCTKRGRKALNNKKGKRGQVKRETVGGMVAPRGRGARTRARGGRGQPQTKQERENPTPSTSAAALASQQGASTGVVTRRVYALLEAGPLRLSPNENLVEYSGLSDEDIEGNFP